MACSKPTTERFVAYSKHHRALCGLLKTPQSALWRFIWRFHFESWMARWLADISQLFSEIIWFFRFFQNTTKRFVAYSKHHKSLCGLYTVLCGLHHSDSVSWSLVRTLCGQNWQRDSLILTGRLTRFPHNPYINYACIFFLADSLFWRLLFEYSVIVWDSCIHNKCMGLWRNRTGRLAEYF